MEDRQLIGLELAAHLVDFFAPNAMLASNRATGGHAQLQDLAAYVFRQGKLTLFVGIEQDQRVHIAVTRVEDVGHGQAALF